MQSTPAPDPVGLPKKYPDDSGTEFFPYMRPTRASWRSIHLAVLVVEQFLSAQSSAAQMIGLASGHNRASTQSCPPSTLYDTLNVNYCKAITKI